MTTKEYAKKRSFTMIETMISIVLLTIIIVSTFLVWNAGDSSLRTETALLSLQQKVRQTMEGMTRELRQGSNFTGSSYDITFNIPSTANLVRYYFDSANNQIMRQHPASSGTIQTLCDNINNLTFTTTLTTINVAISSKKTINQKNLFFNLTEKVQLRN